MKDINSLEGALTLIVERHLGKDVEGIAFDPNYSNRMLARKFEDFYFSAHRKFDHSQARIDKLTIAKMKGSLASMGADFLELNIPSKTQLNLLSEEYFKEWFVGIEHEIEADRLNSDNPIVDPEYYVFLSRGFAAVCARIDQILDHLSGEFPEKPVSSKVNWSACATAHMARVAWAKRKGREAPKSVHADAQGPFGDFLSEILDEITDTYWEYEKPITARSALRALENITSRGLYPRGNW